MKVGDVVMFTNRGRYAQWFYGKIAVIEHLTVKAADGRSHCRVKWLNPVEYYGRYTDFSDFPLEYFEAPNDESR